MEVKKISVDSFEKFETLASREKRRENLNQWTFSLPPSFQMQPKEVRYELSIAYLDLADLLHEHACRMWLCVQIDGWICMHKGMQKLFVETIEWVRKNAYHVRTDYDFNQEAGILQA